MKTLQTIGALIIANLVVIIVTNLIHLLKKKQSDKK